MITSGYIKLYRDIFKEILKNAPTGWYDECTLPSYAHANKIVSWLFWKRLDSALTLAGDLRGKRVLDFGCGGGVLFRYFKERNCVVTGCENQFHELSEEMARTVGIDEVVTDLDAVRGVKFDYIFALDVLEHVYDLDRLLNTFIEISHAQTKIILSGPTESLLYRLGRRAIGYAGQGRFHDRNIYDVEKAFRIKSYQSIAIKKLFPFLTLFRVSVWKLLRQVP